jgi:hypothetical protein
VCVFLGNYACFPALWYTAFLYNLNVRTLTTQCQPPSVVLADVHGAPLTNCYMLIDHNSMVF